MAVEKLCGIKPTPRCDYLRVILSEMNRLTDHLTCVGAAVMELGAFSGFLYFVKARELYYDLMESVDRRKSQPMRGPGSAACGGYVPEGFEAQSIAAIKETRGF